MAKRIDDKKFNWSENTGRPHKYPWSEWADGSIWLAKEGEDFDTTKERFRGTLYAKAIRNKQKVRTKSEGKNVFFQFYKPESV